MCIFSFTWNSFLCICLYYSFGRMTWRDRLHVFMHELFSLLQVVQRYNSCLLASLSNSYHLQIKIVDVFAQALVSEIKSYKPQYNTILRYIPIWEKIFRDKSACVFFTVRCICTCVCIIYSVELYFCYVCLHIFGCWIPIGVILTRLVCPSYYFGITKI